MKVSRLIELLKQAPQDADVELAVYGHVYNSYYHRGTHGKMCVWNFEHTVKLSSGVHIPPTDNNRLIGSDTAD